MPVGFSLQTQQALSAERGTDGKIAFLHTVSTPTT